MSSNYDLDHLNHTSLFISCTHLSYRILDCVVMGHDCMPLKQCRNNETQTSVLAHIILYTKHVAWRQFTFCCIWQFAIISERSDYGLTFDTKPTNRCCPADYRPQPINSSPPGQNGRHFADDMFKRIFLNENIWTSNKMSLKYVPWVLIDSMTALVQIMAWCRPGDKPLSEPMLTQFIDAYIRHYGGNELRHTVLPAES